MDDERFATPVYVADGSRIIREIACLEDAIDFLEAFRAPVNGTVHETELKACYRAAAGMDFSGISSGSRCCCRHENGLTDSSSPAIHPLPTPRPLWRAPNSDGSVLLVSYKDPKRPLVQL
jgi:hypothetical protein